MVERIPNDTKDPLKKSKRKILQWEFHRNTKIPDSSNDPNEFFKILKDREKEKKDWRC